MGYKWCCAVLMSCLFAYSIQAGAQTKAESKTRTDRTACGKNSDPAYAICRGPWSGKTISLFNTWMAPDTNPDRKLRLPSPDKSKVLIVDGFQVRLLVNGRTLWTPFGNMHDAEVAWSPDSKRLFVTWSESGELGPWHVQVYELTDSGLIEFKDITKEAQRDILQRERKAPIPKWVTREYRGMWHTLDYCEPDMIGSQWLNGSKEILVAARAGPDSGCRYMADIVVYRLDAETGKILQTYKAHEAHRVFGDEDLPAVDADDDDL
jgi:hypothetical protein